MLCEKLGYTLAELQDRMTQEELIIWNAFYKWRADEQEKSRKKAEEQARRRR